MLEKRTYILKEKISVIKSTRTSIVHNIHNIKDRNSKNLNKAIKIKTITYKISNWTKEFTRNKYIKQNKINLLFVIHLNISNLFK